VEWKKWHGMVMNAAFDAEIKAAAPDGKPLLMLCQLGGRATQAAKRATELGLTAYNVRGGFEGEADAQGQRGHKSGWRAAGLPWRQK
jgi:rhodanese-related sulfurtransferase